MPLWLTILCVLAAIAAGVPLMAWATAPLRRNKAFALASALFFAFGVYNPNAAKIVEGREDIGQAKRRKAPGDPPLP